MEIMAGTVKVSTHALTCTPTSIRVVGVSEVPESSLRGALRTNIYEPIGRVGENFGAMRLHISKRRPPV